MVHITSAPARTTFKEAGGDRTCTVEVLLDIVLIENPVWKSFNNYISRNLMSIYDIKYKMFKIENNRTKWKRPNKIPNTKLVFCLKLINKKCREAWKWRESSSNKDQCGPYLQINLLKKTQSQMFFFSVLAISQNVLLPSSVPAPTPAKLGWDGIILN